MKKASVIAQDQEVYNAAQYYRHVPVTEQTRAINAYQELVDLIERKTMSGIDKNMIQALISQAPVSELMEVKDLIDKELAWNRTSDALQQEVAAKVGDNDIRATPRYPREGILGATSSPYPMAGMVGQPMQAQTTNLKNVSQVTSDYKPALRYDLIPRALLERAAERWTMGIPKHGERTYQQYLGNREYIIERINHINEHWHKLLHPDYRHADSPSSEDGIDINSIRANLGALLFGIGVLCEVAEHDRGVEIFHQLRREGRLKTHED